MKQLVALAVAMVIAVSTNAANLNKVYEDDRSTVFFSEKSRSGNKVEAYVTTSYKQNYQSKDCKRQFIGDHALSNQSNPNINQAT